MSRVFIETLEMKEPDVDLGVGSGPHGAQTGRMLEALEARMVEWRPSLVLVYGDTNSTLAGALAAAKLHIPVAHVEAGLRSFNRQMPEELNRVVTDHLSRLLFVPTDAAVCNLAAEGIQEGVVRTGDVMFDACILFRPMFEDAGRRVIERLGLRAGGYAVMTVHRAETTDDPKRWSGVLEAIGRVTEGGMTVVWPVHPRVRRDALPKASSRLVLCQPVSYLEMQGLLMSASLVLTDSGGLQKEAAFHQVPCITLRDETEWGELVELGVNQLAGTDPSRVVEAVGRASWPMTGLPDGLYGYGRSSEQIAREVASLVC